MGSQSHGHRARVQSTYTFPNQSLEGSVTQPNLVGSAGMCRELQVESGDTHAKLTDLSECGIRMSIRCEDCEYEQSPRVLLGNGHTAVSRPRGSWVSVCDLKE